MILEILQALTAFLGGGGTVLLGNYIRTSWGNRVEPPNTKESLAHAIERGHKLIETMGKDVLRLWHPPNADGSPCNCAYCEIRGDDAVDGKKVKHHDETVRGWNEKIVDADVQKRENRAIQNLETQLKQLSEALTDRDTMLRDVRQKLVTLRQAEAEAKMYQHAYNHPGGSFLYAHGDRTPVRYNCERVGCEGIK